MWTAIYLWLFVIICPACDMKAAHSIKNKQFKERRKPSPQSQVILCCKKKFQTIVASLTARALILMNARLVHHRFTPSPLEAASIHLFTYFCPSCPRFENVCTILNFLNLIKDSWHIKSYLLVSMYLSPYGKQITHLLGLGWLLNECISFLW